MGQIYSTSLLIAQLSLGDSAFVDLEPPYTYVIRDITIYFDTGADELEGCDVTLQVDHLTFWRATAPTRFAGNFHWEGRIVVPSPASISAQVTANAESSVNLFISGYQLTPP